MVKELQDAFDEILRTERKNAPLAERYRTLEQILNRCLKTLTRDCPVDFTNMAARLHWLCKQTGHKAYPLEVFRARAYQIRKQTLQPNGPDYPYDLKAVCEGLAAFCHTPLPQQLAERLPQHWKSIAMPDDVRKQTKRMRVTVHHWNNRFIYGRENDAPRERLLKISYVTAGNTIFAQLGNQLYEGAQLNLLSVKWTVNDADDSKEHPYVLQPEMLVLDPDFLMDITAVAGCIRPYGWSPYTHLLLKFAPAERSAVLQAGNAANQFLDDCVNENDAAAEQTEDRLYLCSMLKSFRQDPLVYSTLQDIDRNFFDQCRKQFHNIRQTVRGSFSNAAINIRKTDVQLEPSFLCEALGLQGRMDLLTCRADKLVELKSGKAEEYPERHPKEEHKLQIGLYKEILYYNMDKPREQVQSFLFYSRYPQLYAIDVARSDIRRLIALRNELVHMEHRLRNGASVTLLQEMTEERINTSGRHDAFYLRYLQPRIQHVLAPLRHMEPLEAAYFHRFLTFMEREQFLAKAGDGRPDSTGGFSETWCLDTPTKQQNGNILTDLHLHPLKDEQGAVTHVRLDFPEYEEDFLPNFRQGDMVMLYERNSEQDNVISRQFFRCVVEDIQPDRMLLRLSYKQRNASVFHCGSLYAVEPGYTDASFSQAYAGLFSFITAPPERKSLLLGTREPETDTGIRLNLPHPDPDMAKIVLQAKQAKDYFLLIGPPGTGKTSVALKCIVEELLSDKPEKQLLLMAYTNRAVDEICNMLSTLHPAPEYIRIGQDLSCAPEFRHRLLKNVISQAQSRRQICDTITPIRLFTGTVSSLCTHSELFCLKRFDVAIIDEASQVLEPQLLPLLCAVRKQRQGDATTTTCAIRKFILIGDHKQLPAVVMQRTEQSRVDDATLNAIGLTDCRNSLFERLHTLNRIQQKEGIEALLHRQGRMHPHISRYVSRKFYTGQQNTIPLRHQQEEQIFDRYPSDPWTAAIACTRMGLISVAPSPEEIHPRSNIREAEATVRLIRTLHALFHLNNEEENIGKRIGIIVPFRAQISMIRKKLLQTGLPGAEDLTIDTVERYQGSQRDVIIFSTTVSRYYQLSTLSDPVSTDGIRIDRKLNVALTRARKQFFLVGNAPLLRQADAYRELLEYLTPLLPDE